MCVYPNNLYSSCANPYRKNNRENENAQRASADLIKPSTERAKKKMEVGV